MRRTMLASCLLLVAILTPSSTALPLPPVIGASTNTVPDGGTASLATDITAAATYRVKNKGPDQKITVRRYDASNEEILPPIEVGNGSSTDVGVPQGGDLTVEDTDSTDSDPNNTNGASVTYQTV